MDPRCTKASFERRVPGPRTGAHASRAWADSEQHAGSLIVHESDRDLGCIEPFEVGRQQRGQLRLLLDEHGRGLSGTVAQGREEQIDDFGNGGRCASASMR